MNILNLDKLIVANKVCGYIILCFIFVSNPITADQFKNYYYKTSNKLILSYTESHALLGGDDASITLKVYSDGSVHVHYPLFMKKAGNYHMNLNQVELNDLVQSLVAKKILEFNSEEVLSEKNKEVFQANLRSEPTLFSISDASTFNIDLNLETPFNTVLNDTAGSLTTKVNKTKNIITWSGIKGDIQQFPNIEAIQNLAKAQQLILDLKADPRLVQNK